MPATTDMEGRTAAQQQHHLRHHYVSARNNQGYPFVTGELVQMYAGRPTAFSVATTITLGAACDTQELPLTRENCKDGGWQRFDGTATFRHPGDGMRFVATGGKER